MLFSILLCTSCALLEQKKPIDRWIGLPLSKLDSHTIFLTTPYETREIEDGVEVRVYKRNAPVDVISPIGILGSTSQVVCNHLFYIKENRIIDHKEVGNCIRREPES